MKEDAAVILADIGISVPEAIRVVLGRIVSGRKFPFEHEIPNAVTQRAMGEADRMTIARFEPPRSSSTTSKKAADPRRADIPSRVDRTKDFIKDRERENAGGRSNNPDAKALMLTLVAREDPHPA